MAVDSHGITTPTPMSDDLKATRIWLNEQSSPLELRLAGKAVTDEHLADLGQSANLQYVDIACTQVTDAGLAHLKGLFGLRELRLSETKITDAGLSVLQGWTRLHRLDLSGTAVTD